MDLLYLFISVIFFITMGVEMDVLANQQRSWDRIGFQGQKSEKNVTRFNVVGLMRRILPGGINPFIHSFQRWLLQPC
jgi:hypothetical protein